MVQYQALKAQAGLFYYSKFLQKRVSYSNFVYAPMRTKRS